MRKVLYLLLSCIVAQGPVNAMNQQAAAGWADFFESMQVDEPVVEHVPLLEAAEKGDLQQVRALLDGGIDVNLRDRAGWTPLYKAVLHSHPLVVKLLLERGAHVDPEDLMRKGALDYREYLISPEVKFKRSLNRLMKGHYSQSSQYLFNRDEVIELIKEHVARIETRRNEMLVFLRAQHSRLGEQSPAQSLNPYVFRDIFELLKNSDR